MVCRLFCYVKADLPRHPKSINFSLRLCVSALKSQFAHRPSQVRARYTRLKPIREIKTAQRGWTLDVLNIVRRLGKPEFTNDDVYAHDRELEQLHPDNRNVRPKIRQQLQILRDTGLLIHVESGRWRLP